MQRNRDLISRLNKYWDAEYLARHPEPPYALKWLKLELGEKWMYKTFEDTMNDVNDALSYSNKPFAVSFKLYQQDAHAVVIDGVENGFIKVRDPDGSHYKMTKEEFKRVWTGEAVFPRK